MVHLLNFNYGGNISALFTALYICTVLIIHVTGSTKKLWRSRLW